MADTCERRQRRKGLGRKNLTILRNLGQVDGGGGCPSTKVTSKGTGLPSDPSLAQSSAKISLGGAAALWVNCKIWRSEQCTFTAATPLGPSQTSSANSPHHSPHVTRHTSHQRPQHIPASDLPSLLVPLPGMLCPQIPTWQAPLFSLGLCSNAN